MEYAFIKWMSKKTLQNSDSNTYKESTIGQYIKSAQNVLGDIDLFYIVRPKKLQDIIESHKDKIKNLDRKNRNAACRLGLDNYLQFLKSRETVANERIDKLQSLEYDKLREEYKVYLEKAAEKKIYKKESAKTANSDAFYIYRHANPASFWAVVTYDNFEKEARNLLTALLEEHSNAEKPDISAYVKYLGYFRDFAYYGDMVLYDEVENGVNMKNNSFNLNTILYGPPGTGKTYNTVIYAVAICDRRSLEEVYAESYENVISRFKELKSEGRIAFTTFHQSYGYEEFIEGIKPVLEEDDNGDDAEHILYKVQSGIFKEFCENAMIPSSVDRVKAGIGENPNIWKVSLEKADENETRSFCMKNNCIRIGWEKYGQQLPDDEKYSGKRELNTFYNKMQKGDIVLSCFNSSTIDAVGVITGDAEWNESFENYNRCRDVNWLVKGIREDITGINNGKSMTLSTVYKLSISIADVLKIVDKYTANGDKVDDKAYVFIIDEINRGNISKIFGELITLIEPSKRIGADEEIRVKLPYSGKTEFGVPGNVYVLGTMNTADRSIASMDTALRRRFNFVEMLPDESLLEDIEVKNIRIKDMLDMMNKRITALFDREHTLGHAYFLPLKKEATIEKLADIFRNNIIPLLQEYFYDDYEKIRMVLGDNQKKNKDNQFITADYDSWTNLFGESPYEQDSYIAYKINDKALENNNSYISIYSGEEA